MKYIDQVLTSICPGPSRSNLKLDIAKRVIQMENTTSQGNTVPLDEAFFEAMNNRILHYLFSICKMSMQKFYGVEGYTYYDWENIKENISTIKKQTEWSNGYFFRIYCKKDEIRCIR